MCMFHFYKLYVIYPINFLIHIHWNDVTHKLSEAKTRRGNIGKKTENMKTTCSEPHSPISWVISLHLAAKLWVISSISLHPYYIPASHLSNIPRSFPIPQVKILWDFFIFLILLAPAPVPLWSASKSLVSSQILSLHVSLLIPLPTLSCSSHAWITATTWHVLAGDFPYVDHVLTLVPHKGRMSCSPWTPSSSVWDCKWGGV